jgi:serine/threonine protein kinase
MPLILDGRYVTLKLLGQGGFGAAFLACDRHDANLRLCVVKQFQPSGSLTPTQLAIAHDLFKREAEALDRLGNAHPQIPDLFASFDLTVPGLPSGGQQQLFYLVQEYIDGLTLEEELAQAGPLSVAAVTTVMVEVLKILQFVHDNGAIHRDIKPSNVMRNQAGVIYLLDFGAVKQVTTAVSPTKSTGIYSQGFAPPEQVAGGQVFACTDFYALAVTCIMLLTGKSHDELYDAYQNSWQWRQYAPAVGAPLDAVLDRMLLAAPNQRFQTVQAVLEALQSPGSMPVPPGTRPAGAQPASPAPRPVVPPTRPPGTALPPPGGPAAPIARSPRGRANLTPFSTLELLSNAAFTGFESMLLAIALFSLPIPSLASALLWFLLSGGFIFAQSRRIVEKVDLPIAASLTFAIVVILATGLKWVKLPLVAIVMVAGLGGLGAIAATALFRLIYKLLTAIFTRLP